MHLYQPPTYLVATKCCTYLQKLPFTFLTYDTIIQPKKKESLKLKQVIYQVRHACESHGQPCHLMSIDAMGTLFCMREHFQQVRYACMHGGTLWVVVYLMSVDAMQCNAMGAVRVPLVLEILEVESSIDSANQVLILPIKC